MFQRFAGARLSIDLDAVVENFNRIKTHVGTASVGAVIKANAYGLGAERIACALERAGCKDFFVAHVGEAAPVVPTLAATSRVFVLNGLSTGAEEACAKLGAIPVLNSLEQIDRWNSCGRLHSKRLTGVIQVDSGMGRLGLSVDELNTLHQSSGRLACIDVVLVMSHLACADDPHASANAAQAMCFAREADRFPGVPRSLANSSGAFLGAPFRNDMVRAGIALYGEAPHSCSINPMVPVVSLTADIVQVRTVPAGEGIGYGLTARADHDRRIAAISVGYGDGWPRRLGNRGSAFIGGAGVPIVGRISMDSMLLDVTRVDRDITKAGDPVELLGPHQSLADVAADADTISYEILTQFGSRYARSYRGGPAHFDQKVAA